MARIRKGDLNLVDICSNFVRDLSTTSVRRRTSIWFVRIQFERKISISQTKKVKRIKCIHSVAVWVRVSAPFFSVRMRVQLGSGKPTKFPEKLG
jgi:hypothetical protein